ncbi:hypothetical protein [Aurantiacibacter spongiae]|uniref:hypothetical protein n=1 Tax=Aurantiacibacter spongiae TaxID=2488860 RepID=UPI0013152CE9|nr:hypothetical protein [Aurantiacibacter spongiae]
MSSAQAVSLVALVGWGILAASAYRAHRIDAAKTTRISLIWLTIFATLFLVVELLR